MASFDQFGNVREWRDSGGNYLGFDAGYTAPQGGGVYNAGGVSPFAPAAQGGPYDNVFTGHATERMPENDPMVQSAMVAAQQMLRNQPQGYARFTPPAQDEMFNPFAPKPEGIVLSGGRRYKYADLVQQAGGEQHALDQFTTAPNRPMADRVSQLLAARDTDPHFRNLSGLQFNQAFTNAVGADPFTYQDRQQKMAANQLDVATKLNALAVNQQDALQKEYEGLGKSAGGLPEDILASFGRNAAPGHQNEYYNPGLDMGIDQMTGERKIEHAGWRGIDPGTVARMRQIRAARGMETQPQAPSLQQVNALIAAEEAARAHKGMGDRQMMDSAALPPRPIMPWEQRELDRMQRVTGWQDWGASPYSY